MKIEKEKKDQLENVKQTQAETQKVLIGRVNPKRGHSLFVVNPDLKTIELADFNKTETVSFEQAKKGIASLNKQIIVKDNCKYIPALNKRNVIKILERDFGIVWNP